MAPTRKDRDKKKARMVSARQMAETSKSGGSSKAFKIPSGVSVFQPKKDTEYTIDIVPFEAGDDNPGADKGFLAAGRTYFAHARIGPNQDSYCCLAGTFNKPCPICEYRARVVADKGWDDPLAKALRAKTRQLWNVYDHAEKKKGVQLWEFSEWCFGKHLFAKMDRKPEYENFADPNEGYTLTIGTSEDKVGSGKGFVVCADIQMTKRKEPLDDELLAKAICLDELLIETPYEKLKAIFESGIGGGGDNGDKDSDSDSDDDEKPKSRAKKDSDDENDEDENDSDTEDEEEEPPVAKKKKKAAVPDDEEDDPDDSEMEPDEEEASSNGKPKKKAKPAGIKTGDTVRFADKKKDKANGECDVLKVSGDGTSLTLENEDGEELRAVDPADVKKVTEDTESNDLDEDDEEPEEKPVKKKGKKAPVDEEEEENEDEAGDGDGDEEPLEDSDDSDDDSDEDDERPAKKPVKKKVKK